MARVSRLLLAALGAVICAGASAGNLAIPSVAYGLLPSNSQQDPAIVTALPPGMSNLDPAALVYFVRWLQCSSLVQWCTPSEVYSRCTYEPKGTWFRGALFINAPQAWPYCSECPVFAIAARLRVLTRVRYPFRLSQCRSWKLSTTAATLRPSRRTRARSTPSPRPWASRCRASWATRRRRLRRCLRGPARRARGLSAC